jgi:hypothetical protein
MKIFLHFVSCWNQIELLHYKPTQKLISKTSPVLFQNRCYSQWFLSDVLANYCQYCILKLCKSVRLRIFYFTHGLLYFLKVFVNRKRFQKGRRFFFNYSLLKYFLLVFVNRKRFQFYLRWKGESSSRFFGMCFNLCLDYI